MVDGVAPPRRRQGIGRLMGGRAAPCQTRARQRLSEGWACRRRQGMASLAHLPSPTGPIRLLGRAMPSTDTQPISRFVSASSASRRDSAACLRPSSTRRDPLVRAFGRGPDRSRPHAGRVPRQARGRPAGDRFRATTRTVGRVSTLHYRLSCEDILMASSASGACDPFCCSAFKSNPRFACHENIRYPHSPRLPRVPF